MKKIFVLTLIVVLLPACKLGNSNLSGRSKNENTPTGKKAELTIKDRFLGTWEVVPEGDFDGGPITFREDNTYSARAEADPNSAEFTGAYEIKGDRLFCLGNLEKDTADGFKFEGDRLSLKIKGKTVYFLKR